MNVIATANHEDLQGNPVGKSRLIDASERYLNAHYPDMDILERGVITPHGMVDIVAKDEIGLHLIYVSSATEGGFPKFEKSLSDCESMAVDMLQMNPDIENTAVTFDHIGFRILSDDKAILRLHSNLQAGPEWGTK